MSKVSLIIAPHADDETLGCGGTIARLAEQGTRVYVAVMTNAHVGAPELFSAAQVAEIRAEAIKAHKILGVTETFFFELPAPRLELYPQYQLANTLASLIQQVQPDTVYVSHKGDLHRDHAAVYNATLVACRPQGANPVKAVYCYETLSETEWGHPTVDAVFIANHFVTLEQQHLQKKLDAMSAFASQLKPFPHSRSLEAITAQAKLRGATIGAPAAEAYMLVRTIV